MAVLLNRLTSPYGLGLSLQDATIIIDHLDLDWNEQAVLAAKRHLESREWTRDELITQLTARYGEGFTSEEANYAADKLGL